MRRGNRLPSLVLPECAGRCAGFEFRAFAVDSGGERLGVVPLLFRRSGPVSTANFLPVGCIGPLIRGEALRAGRIGELLRGADAVLRRHRTVAARLAFAPGLHLSPEDLAIPEIRGVRVGKLRNAGRQVGR